MRKENKQNCPLNNFEPCKLWECSWFIEIQGKNPQTGVDINEWGCSVAWLPVMLIENSQMQRQTGAAVESFRNEMVRANETSQRVLLQTAKVIKGENTDIKLIGDQ